MDTSPTTVLPHFADLLLDAVVMVDQQGRIVYISAACERIFGYRQHEMIGQAMLDFVAPEDRARTLEEAGKVMSGLPRIGFENRYVRKDGSRVHIMWSARWSEEDRMRIGVARDVTEHKRVEEMQAAIYAVSEAARDAVDLGVLFSDIHRIIAKLVSVAGFAVATCAPKTKQLAFPYQADMHGASTFAEEAIVAHHCVDAIGSRKPVLFSRGAESWLIVPLVKNGMAVGALVMKSCPGTAYSDRDKELLQFVSAQVAAAMESAQLHAELLHSARYDDLTGLPNRRLFLDRMKSALARCRRRRSNMAVLYIDIDDFKLVNDTLGHAGGDLLLQEFARRLQDSVREADTVARMGGDEFVVLLEEVQQPADAEAVADKIRTTASQPIVVNNRVLRTRASIGIALYPENGMDTDDLLGCADRAMYADKHMKNAVKSDSQLQP
jgi:diguanylate cyclase (GGDEF)-like protein/PAS domain S-box-containing protein